MVRQHARSAAEVAVFSASVARIRVASRASRERGGRLPAMPQPIDERIYDLYDDYCHSGMERREFLRRAAGVEPKKDRWVPQSATSS